MTTSLQERMPGFCVQLGYGLHYGWAIEGAIGSKHKIDASYLSPHVNMASRLEAATKQVESVLQLHHKQSAQKLRMLCTLRHLVLRQPLIVIFQYLKLYILVPEFTELDTAIKERLPLHTLLRVG